MRLTTRGAARFATLTGLGRLPVLLRRLRRFSDPERTIEDGRFIWPSFLMTFLTVGLFVLGVGAVTRGFDQEDSLREEAVVQSGLAERVREVEIMVLPQVIWDEAVTNLDNRFDRHWAQLNVGKYLSQTQGFFASVVVDAKDRPLFGWFVNREVTPPHAAVLRNNVDDLIRAVRSRELRRGRLHPSPHDGIVARPVQASAIRRFGAQLFIVTATIVQPDFGTAMPRLPRAPILLTAMAIDPAFLRSFARRYQLDDLRLTIGARRPADAANRIEVRAQGKTLGYLQWRPRRPGASVARRLTPPLAAAVIVIVVLAMLLINRNRRMAEELLARERHMSHLAHYDGLTGLPNRRSFYLYMDVNLAEARVELPVAVFCIDLDRFKEINDSYGHHAGDELIQKASMRLAGICRDVAYFARLAGDEFGAVMVGRSPKEVSALASAMCRAIEQPFDLECGHVFIGCSVGIATLVSPSLDRSEALRRADLALYRAKEDGRGRYCHFDDTMDALLRARRAMEKDLRDAIGTTQFRMVYQPQIAADGTIVGVEALMRWEHPEKGAISPAIFIPAAEECGLIGAIGWQALRTIFAETRGWRNLRVAVNVSPVQLRMHDFVPRFFELAKTYNIDLARYELEITESALLKEDAPTLEKLEILRAAGVTLALDDFGTGYSSLSYLRRFPINKIKIDRSFIASLGVDPEAIAVVGAIVKLARALKMSVIAEGVETQAQDACLRLMGCSTVQGFLHCRPLPAASFKQMLDERSDSSATLAVAEPRFGNLL